MRITQRDLDAVVKRINYLTHNPETPYSKVLTDNPHVHSKANIGNYHLDYAYGGVRLVQMVNNGGGIRNITNGGYGAKRECYNEMQSYVNGILDAQLAKAGCRLWG